MVMVLVFLLRSVFVAFVRLVFRLRVFFEGFS